MLASNAFPALLKRLRPYTVPVYDYALMTEPLSAEQLASVGWKNRQGLGDGGVFFHYFRISEDDRILWGGWDAIYHWRNGIRPEFDQRRETFELLSRQFFAMFPQLQGLRFTHGWGGVIDVCSRFSPFFGTALGGRVAYALGFTGRGSSGRRVSAPTSASTCWPASRPSARRCRSWAASRCPGRPSRCVPAPSR